MLYEDLDQTNARELYLHVIKTTGSSDRAKKAVESYLDYFSNKDNKTGNQLVCRSNQPRNDVPTIPDIEKVESKS